MPTTNPKLFDLLYNNLNLEIQCNIEDDELNDLQNAEKDKRARERELMLRNAKMKAHTEAFYAEVKVKKEENEAFPKENYDWRQSGLYQQIYDRYQDDKENLVREAAKKAHYMSLNEEERKKVDLMKDPGYRKALKVVLHSGGGD